MGKIDKDQIASFLERIFTTNHEFATNYGEEFFQKIKDSQEPKLTILKCSDSRVQLESFDRTPQNGVFAVRNIGNQICTSEGSVDFGVEMLKTPFLLILGHSGCAAVQASIENYKTNISNIDKELSTLSLKSTNSTDGIIENINNQVNFAVKKYKNKINSKELMILGAVYDFRNDFKFGFGKIVLTSINGNKISAIEAKEYSENIKFFNYLA